MKRLAGLTLMKKVALLAAIGLSLGVGLYSFLSMQALHRSTDAMLQERLMTTHLIADYADEVLGRALSELESCGRAIATEDPQGDVGQQMDGLLDTYSRMSLSNVGAFLLDRDGHIEWSTLDHAQTADIDLSDYPSIQQSLETGEAGISGLVPAPASGTPAVLLTCPSEVGEQAADDVLVVAIDLSKSSIAGFIQPIELGLTGYVEIVDQTGVVIARTEPGRELAPFEKSDHPDRFAALIDVGEPTVGTCHTCHTAEEQVEKRSDVLAFAPLSRAPWGVAIRQSEEEALAPTRELRRGLIFSGVGLVAAAFIFVGVMTRDVVGRIRMLTNASRRIADGDLTSALAPLGGDEIGILARTLDEMRLRLGVSYNDIEQRTKELSSLLTVSEVMTSGVDLAGILSAVVDKAVEVIPAAEGGALLEWDNDLRKLTVRAVSGLDVECPSEVALNAYTGVPPVAVSTQADGRIGTAARDMCASLLRLAAVGGTIRCAICSPLVHGVECVGALVMASSRDTEAFSEPDLRLLKGIADYLQIAIERVRLTEEADEARALREADHLKSQFISSVSHELRTPLTSIKGYSSSLLRRDVSWDEATTHEFIQTIDEKADELKDLIDKLLLMARLEAGALEPQREPILVARLAQKVVEQAAARAKRHEFVLEFPSTLPVVEADARLVEQVLSNLVENAVKYSPEGSKVVIRGELSGDRIVVSVGDEGAGISPEHRDKVFERFYRVDDPSTRGTPGSGLGLSIARGHVEAHGGEIWLESTVGRGSTFYFSLPLEAVDVGEKKEHRG